MQVKQTTRFGALKYKSQNILLRERRGSGNMYISEIRERYLVRSTLNATRDGALMYRVFQ